MKYLLAYLLSIPAFVFCQKSVSLSISDTLLIVTEDAHKNKEYHIQYSNGFYLIVENNTSNFYIFDSTFHLHKKIKRYKPETNRIPFSALFGYIFLPKTAFFHSRALLRPRYFQYLSKENIFAITGMGTVYIFDYNLKFIRSVPIKIKNSNYRYKYTFDIDENTNTTFFQISKQHKEKEYSNFFNDNKIIAKAKLNKPLTKTKKIRIQTLLANYDSLYIKEKYIPYLTQESNYHFLKNEKTFIVNTEANHQIIKYDLNGKQISSFGVIGKYVHSNEHVLDTNKWDKNVSDRFMLYRLKSAEYQLRYVDDVSGNIYRTYYSGLTQTEIDTILKKDSLKMAYPLMYYKKLYLQIYNKERNLIYDAPSPFDPLNIINQKGNKIYVHTFTKLKDGKYYNLVLVYELKENN